MIRHVIDTLTTQYVKWYYPDGNIKKEEKYRVLYPSDLEQISYTKYYPNGQRAFIMDTGTDKRKYYTVYQRCGKRVGKWVDDYNLANYFYKIALHE